MDVYLGQLSYALGDTRFTVHESTAAGRTLSSAASLIDAGFSTHYICSPQRSAYDLARAAVEPLRPYLGGTSALVYATCLPQNGNLGERSRYEATRDVKHLLNFPASHLQADFALDHAQVFGINQQACTSLFGAVQLATMLIRCEPTVAQVLCLTADRFPEGALYEQSYNLISDGAAAMIVSRKPGDFRILASVGLTNGALAQASDDESVGVFFNYTHRIVAECLAKAKLTLDDLAYTVPQNMNIKAWQILSRLLGIDFARVAMPSLSEVGHLISGDNLINLQRLNQSGSLQVGAKVLLVSSGYGLNWQCMLLEKCAGGIDG